MLLDDFVRRRASRSSCHTVRFAVHWRSSEKRKRAARCSSSWKRALAPGSVARAQRCHRTTGVRVLGVKRAAPAAGAGEEEDEAETYGEVYEDADFYHSLLKELLDDGSSAAAPGAPKLKHKKRKTDNRQSKGRKLSYEVQPKLLSFMFPEVPERPVVLAELFASVFGQRAGSRPPPHAQSAKRAAGGGGAAREAALKAPEASSVAVDVATLFAPG